MYQRSALAQIAAALKRSPAVAVLGPRQVGKTTLAKQLAGMANREFVYLDLQDERDRARIADPNVFFKTHQNALIVLDEVQYTPDIFRHLRPEIDRDRSNGRFLLLGSASFSLLKQSALLRDTAYRAKLVLALAAGIQRYFARHPPLARQRPL